MLFQIIVSGALYIVALIRFRYLTNWKRGELMAKGRDAQKTVKKKSEKTLKEKRKEKKEKKSKKSKF